MASPGAVQKWSANGVGRIIEVDASLLGSSITGRRARRSPRTLDLLLVGAAKAGTTTLFRFLASHPHILMSTPKETHYFERNETFDPAVFWSRYFSRWKGEPLVGEATPANLYVPYVAPRIRDAAPGAKLIILLRDPVERAFSHWWMRYAEGLEKLPFEEALAANLRQLEGGLLHERTDAEAVWRDHMAGREQKEIRWRSYLDAGYYAVQIKRYQQLFPPEQLLILLTEDLRSEPEATLRKVWNFLRIPEPPRTSYDVSVNEAVSIRGAALLRLVKGRSYLRLIPSPVKSVIRTWMSRGEGPLLKRDTEQWLAQYYRRWNQELTDILGFEPPWR